MCGITGLFHFIPPSSSEECYATVSRMVQTLSHRGPDSCGNLVQYPVAFGHTRLSILDLSPAGAQPMRLQSEDQDLILTYNGEIYNHIELRRELDSCSHRSWRGHSDTETILHAYAEWGLEGLKRLEGIFALALWDAARRRLVLMRDRLGVKPLFYGSCHYGLAFGSEIKAVLAAGGINSDLDDQAFSEYLWYGNAYSSRTFFKGVRSLEPGNWLIIENGKQSIEPWWCIEEWLHNPASSPNPSDASVLLRETLDDAVARQSIADVPVGLFLSGGIDSSAIAAAAAQQGIVSLQCYSAGFDYDNGVDELPKAARVASHLGLKLNQFRLQGGELESTLQALVTAHDEPFADAANIPLFLMCKQLRSRAKVVLQGDGGDELFAGYRRYGILRNAGWWRAFPKALSPILRAQGSLGRRCSRIADTVGQADSALRMAYLLTVETPHKRPELLFQSERRHYLEEATDPFLAYRLSAERFARFDPVKQMMLTDLTVQLPFQFLVKVDRATMAQGIEARVPLLDELVVRLAVSLPSIWNVDRFQKKIILRNSQRKRLPREILDSPKTGFGVPYGEWLRTSLYDFTCSHLLDHSFLDTFSLRRDSIESMLSAHRHRQHDGGFTLWKLLQLAIWRHQYKPA